ncbi:hypothetical protein GPJ56_002393 [Histomonas meleagridis]|uniref:uncharacterized protein n=1 Tax=Histomonas meleagridis TaxID=135588 RepID=UPI00355A2F5B|nr:hypothetical protein GPJ56_002393 [Histomonas meleagridis]KAH0801875.1 hypothetical protein GO595_005293 [Histomonas meleagridis]
MVSLLAAYRNYFRSHGKAVLLTLVATVVLWILLAMGFLPTYDENELQRKAAYFFPVWIILALTALAVIEENIRSPPPQKVETPQKPETEQPAK